MCRLISKVNINENKLRAKVAFATISKDFLELFSTGFPQKTNVFTSVYRQQIKRKTFQKLVVFVAFVP